MTNTFISNSIRLGIFLRRYPVARVFVILYMVSVIIEMRECSVAGKVVFNIRSLFMIVFLFPFSLQAVLHLWVMIVLLTYTPEMHGRPDGR